MAPLASTATPRNPASSARTTVPGPMAGMSTRISWRGLGRLTSTPRRRPTPPSGWRRCKASRASMASVFSAPSMASMRPSVTTTACPTSNGPSARTTSKPRAMSTISFASACIAPSGPSPTSSEGSTSIGETTLKPLLSKKRTTPLSTPSSPVVATTRAMAGRLRKKPRSGLMAPRSGRRTEPTMTISVTPALRSARSMPPICAQPTLVSGKSLRSRSPSPMMETMCTAPPPALTCWAISRGRLPPPATMPTTRAVPDACRCECVVWIARTMSSDHQPQASAASFGVHRLRLPPARMNSRISCTIGCPANSWATSAVRSASVPSAANSRR